MLKTFLQNSRQEWGRRLISFSVAILVSMLMVYLQPLVGLSEKLVQTFIEMVKWLGGLMLAGVSATDAVKSWAETKVPCGNGDEEDEETAKSRKKERPKRQEGVGDYD